MPHSNPPAQPDRLASLLTAHTPVFSQTHRSHGLDSVVVNDNASTSLLVLPSQTHWTPSLLENTLPRLGHSAQRIDLNSEPAAFVLDVEEPHWHHDRLLFGHAARTKQSNVYSVTYNTTLPTPRLQVDIFKTRGQHPTACSLPLFAGNNCDLILWGGERASTTPSNTSHSLYILSTISHSWKQHQCSGPSPTGLTGSSVIVLQDYFFLFAGCTSDGVINSNLWRIKLDTVSPFLQWELLPISSSIVWPPPRHGHSGIRYQSFWIIFGGTGDSMLLKDTWAYNFSFQKWTPIDCTGSPPAPRTGHLCNLIGNKLIVSGGHGINGDMLMDISVLDLDECCWFLLKDNITLIQTQGQVLTAWENRLVVFGGHARSHGQLNNTTLYHTLDIAGRFPSSYQSNKPLVKSVFTPHIELFLGDEYPVDNNLPFKRLRPNKHTKRWKRNEAKTEAHLILPNTSKHETIFHFFIPPSNQHDPCPADVFTLQKMLVHHYTPIYKGICVISPNNLPPFCMAKWLPFTTMSDAEKTGWERLVLHFLRRIDYVAPVNTNGPQAECSMWADGWRKASKDDQHFGRFCSVDRLRKQMKALKFNPDDQKARLLKAGEWISSHLRSFTLVVHDNYHELLTINQYPSMNHTEYGEPYTSLDFTSFLTFTMYDFHNTPHVDNDVNDWTLVAWIPIFSPKNNSDNTQILADEGFDMVGGQFSFRDFQVYLDLNKTLGVTLCVFKFQEYCHQTLPGASQSGNYTRLGFFCQINKRMAAAVTAYVEGNYEKELPIGGLQQQIANAEAPPKKKKKKA
ncbi:hypothetical protein PCASD_26239 [Puccinia coronata f. sp. avenae]|uniref:Tet-like 2OG-Fe(II) oxygenase domain-containing protein n=1 Tax=Puccinia coronata f. sp. avenae TaxID=200324 RepID=A0A2N5S7N2_9BASI|nr:hypothetical protein PCASD_26239 [Puccinia coronata f. sp. avenae]